MALTFNSKYAAEFIRENDLVGLRVKPEDIKLTLKAEATKYEK